MYLGGGGHHLTEQLSSREKRQRERERERRIGQKERERIRFGFFFGFDDRETERQAGRRARQRQLKRFVKSQAADPKIPKCVPWKAASQHCLPKHCTHTQREREREREPRDSLVCVCVRVVRDVFGGLCPQARWHRVTVGGGL